MKKESALFLQGALAGAGAFLSAKLGILFPVLCLFMLIMIIDYLSGMAASKYESLDHPGDSSYGWSSRKGAKGILKKVGYLCVIMVAMVFDYILARISGTLDFHLPIKAFFGLLVTVWYLLNELLSIIENAGRMGANMPDWLRKYIAVLKDKIDQMEE